MTKHSPSPRTAYRHFLPITTRWMDNDVYGHVNNVVYYSYFDTVVNEYLIRAGVLDVEHGVTIGLVVETQCKYFAPLVFPERVEAGLRVTRLGTTRWVCSRTATRSRLQKVILCMSMWIGSHAGPLHCLSNCGRHSKRLSSTWISAMPIGGMWLLGRLGWLKMGA
jgi:acyl-CoA thioesterase FadM